MNPPHPQVTVVGSINQDMVARVPQLPRPGETVLGHDLVMVPGGKGLNQAVAAARSGVRTAIVGLVGEDSAGFHLRTVLAEEGIDTHGVGTVGALTGRALIAVADDGENHIVVVPGANWALDEVYIEEHRPAIALSAVVLTQLEIPLATVRATLREARAGGARTVLNATPPLAFDDALCTLIDFLIVNEHEASAMVARPVLGPGDATDAGVSLRARGFGAVIVTLGADGAVLVGDGTSIHQRAFVVEAVDTTGAGDAFAGAFAAQLAEGAPLTRALRWASAAAALAVTTRGAAPSIPFRDHVRRLLGRVE